MQPLEYLKKHAVIYAARDTYRRFIPLEAIAKEPGFYGIDLTLPDGYKSNAQQADYIASKKKIVAAKCGNRSGKSEVMAIKSIKILEAEKSDRGGRFWILTESYDLHIAGIQAKIKMYFKPERILKDSIAYAKKNCYLSFTYVNKHGIHIPVEFKTYEQGSSKLQAAKLIGAAFDEEPPEDIYDEVYTRTVDLSGQIIMAFTPLKGITWSYDRIFNGSRDRIDVFQWGMFDNPFIPRDEIDEMMANWSHKKVRMRLYGDYQGAEGQVYETFDRKRNMVEMQYNAELPVSVAIDWGIACVSVGFFQQSKQGKHYLIDAFEAEGMGYGHVLTRIRSKNYYIPEDEWFCDPAGRARSQATKTGVSLLKKIQEEYGITFKYISHLGIEESIEIVDSWFLNAKDEVKLYICAGIKLNAKEETPEQRIENYVRDDKTHMPLKDGVVDHFNDMLRYYVANKSREKSGRSWKQS